MNTVKGRKILFIINPKSWEFTQEQTRKELSAFSEKYNFLWEYYITREDDDSSDIGNKINNYEPEIVVAAGGDGTVNLVATQLIGKSISLGIIPAGSANGLAYNLDIPVNFNDAMHIIGSGSKQKLDVIRMNGSHYCFHLSDIGINARIVHRFEKEGDKGLIGYGKQMIKEVFSKGAAFSFQLKANNISKKYHAEMLVIANARSYGTGAAINPQGKPDDGKFELIIIKPYPWWILGSLMFSFFTAKLDKMKYVDIIQTEKASVLLDKPGKLQKDGEILENIKELEIDILPSSLEVIVNS